VIDDVHRVDLLVHPYTFRVENQFLPTQRPGDLEDELRPFLRGGIDGFFTDNPAIGSRHPVAPIAPCRPPAGQ